MKKEQKLKKPANPKKKNLLKPTPVQKMVLTTLIDNIGSVVKPYHTNDPKAARRYYIENAEGFIIFPNIMRKVIDNLFRKDRIIRTKDNAGRLIYKPNDNDPTMLNFNQGQIQVELPMQQSSQDVLNHNLSIIRQQIEG